MKLNHMNRRMVTLATGVLLSTALVGGQFTGVASAKKTRSITVTTSGQPDGVNFKGPLTSPQLGKGTQGGKMRLPEADYIFKFKGGSIYGTGTGTTKGVDVTGTWKITKGTGKFKGIKGKKGTYKGSLATFVFVFKIKATY